MQVANPENLVHLTNPDSDNGCHISYKNTQYHFWTFFQFFLRTSKCAITLLIVCISCQHSEEAVGHSEVS